MSNCRYCGGNCENEPEDSKYLCDGFAGDIDGLYKELTSDQVDAITHAWLDLEASKVLFNRMCGVPSFADRPPLQRTRMLEELAVACRDSVKELEDAFPFLMEGVEDELT